MVGFPVDVPPYPFYVNASSTHPQGKLSQPGYALEATAAPGDASASAQSGQAGADAVVGHALSTAHAWLDGEYLPGGSGEQRRPLPDRAAASGRRPVNGGRLRSGHRRDAHADTSHLEVAAASVGDVPVTFTPQGVTLAGDSPAFRSRRTTPSPAVWPRPACRSITCRRRLPWTPWCPLALRIRAVQTFPGIDKQLQVTYLIGSAVAHAVASTVAGDPVPSVPTPPDAGPIPGTASGGDEACLPSAAAPAGQGTASGTADLPGPRPGHRSRVPGWPNPAAGQRSPAPGAAEDRRVVMGGGGTAAVGEPGLNAEGGPGPDGTVQAALSSSESGLHSTSAEAMDLVGGCWAWSSPRLYLPPSRQLGVRAPARIGG